MTSLPIPPSTLDGIKRRAKSFKREQSITHHQALDLAAIEAGYQNFSHVQAVLLNASLQNFSAPHESRSSGYFTMNFLPVFPEDALRRLHSLSQADFLHRIKPEALSGRRQTLLFDILQGRRQVDVFYKFDIQCFALKALFKDYDGTLPPASHLYSKSELFEFDPAKNGQNLIKHGIGFGEMATFAKPWGRLLVACPDRDDGERYVMLSNLDAGEQGKNLELGFPKMAGAFPVLSIVQQKYPAFRFISSRRLSRTSYREDIDHALKNICDDDVDARRSVFERCVEIVEADLLPACALVASEASSRA